MKKTLFEKIKSIVSKKYAIPIVIAAAAITLLLISNGAGGKGAEVEQGVPYSRAMLSRELEERIAELCESVAGVNRATVFLTLDTSEEYVYAKDTENNGEYRRSEIVRVDTGGGIELCVVSPKVRGVAIVCTGGERASVRKTITELVASALGIDSSKISVAGR